MKNIKKIITILLGVFFSFNLVACSKEDKITSDKIISFEKSNATMFDFSKKDGTKSQYIKKFDQFATTWGFVGDTPGSIRRSSLNSIPALSELKAENLRFDLFMGYNGLGYNIGSTAELNGSSDKEYEQSLQVINKLIENNINPQLVLFANPAYSQPYGDWKSVPIAEKWKELCKNMSLYFKNNNKKIGAYEIWNEPDLGETYFSGNWQDYINTYLAGAKGLREGDSDAFIQAVSASWIYKLCQEVESTYSSTKFERFIEATSQENILPDSISWHFYGRDNKLEDITGIGGDGVNFSVYRNAILNSLNSLQEGTSQTTSNKYSDLVTMQQALNEFNIYQPLVDATYKTNSVVPGMFDAMETLINANDITRVNWATFLSEQINGLGCSAIDSYTLQRYPAYHANWIYSHLPIDRIEQPVMKNGLKSMASVDNNRAGLLIYNTTKNNKNIKVALNNLPFKKGNIKVYAVDSEHLTYSSFNEPIVLEQYENADLENLKANINLIADGAYYIEVNSLTGASDTDILNSLSNNIVRKDYFYPQRGDNTPYSEIHNNSLTAHLSMNNNDLGTTAISLLMENMKNIDKLKIGYELWGNSIKKEDSSLGIKIDYETDGGFIKSVYYCIEGHEKDIILPFGKKTLSDEKKTLSIINLNSAEIDLISNAPENWNGRISLSLLMENAGKGTTAKIIIKN